MLDNVYVLISEGQRETQRRNREAHVDLNLFWQETFCRLRLSNDITLYCQDAFFQRQDLVKLTHTESYIGNKHICTKQWITVRGIKYFQCDISLLYSLCKSSHFHIPICLPHLLYDIHLCQKDDTLINHLACVRTIHLLFKMLLFTIRETDCWITTLHCNLKQGKVPATQLNTFI